MASRDPPLARAGSAIRRGVLVGAGLAVALYLIRVFELIGPVAGRGHIAVGWTGGCGRIDIATTVGGTGCSGRIDIATTVGGTGCSGRIGIATTVGGTGCCGRIGIATTVGGTGCRGGIGCCGQSGHCTPSSGRRSVSPRRDRPRG